MRRLRIAYVPLAAAYPVVFLFAHNVDRAFPSDLVAPLVVVLAATGVALVVGRLLLGTLDKAGVVVAVGVLSFLSYGQVYARLEDVSLLGVSIGRDRFLLPVWIAGLIGLVIFARRSQTLVTELAPVLNVVAAALIAFPLVSVGRSVLASPTVDRSLDASVVDARPGPLGTPDVYYLIFDRYASKQTLERYYGFDNGPMIEFLSERGFRVLESSRANYPKTPHSLAASLNMRYLDDLPERSHDWKLVASLLRGSRVARTFKDLGYTYVFVGSGYRALCTDPLADVRRAYRSCNEFAQLVYTSTAVYPFVRHLGLEGLDTRRQQWHRTRFQFAEVASVAGTEGPTFTFAHFNLPHDPWVFDADGRYIDEQEGATKPWMEGYLDQLRYANEQIRELVDALLAGPDDPIIVIQSDEGPGPIGWDADTPGHYDWTAAPQRAIDEKFQILNALHLPGVDAERVAYDGMTPVNTFRALLRGYFGADLEPLPDRSYVFPTELQPYRFIDVTARAAAGADDDV